MVLVLNLIAPFAVYYAVGLAKRGDLNAHRQLQNGVFLVCVVGVLVLEGLIRFSGGSGSLVQNSSYSGTPVFRGLLVAHIIGALLTYLLWTCQVIASNRKFGKSLPGKFSSAHKLIGYLLFFGLSYTALTAALVYALIWL